MKGGVKNMTNDVERFTLRIPKELKVKLESQRKQRGVSLNSLVLQILWDWKKKASQEDDAS